MRSVMSHSFSQVPSANIPRSSFNRSFGHKTTFDAGYLVPIMWDLAYPGDTFKLRMNMLGRLNTPIVPIMDNMFCETFFFSVPIRLVWDNFQKFMGEQIDPDDSIDYTLPRIIANPTGYTEHSIFDYFGLPTKIVQNPSYFHSVLWLRSYNLIWNEWFRDENLQDSVTVLRTDGSDSYTNYTLLRRGKRHDYFSSCLPWPQKWDAVSLPLGTEAPVVSTGEKFKLNTGSNIGESLYEVTSGGTTLSRKLGNPGTTGDAYFGTVTGLEADLSDATAATINELRQAFQIQRLYERDARGGSRYTEIIRSHFGVVSPDARLQRPEYLGGGSSRINVHPIAQTSESDTTPQGNLAAMGVVSAGGHGFTKSFTEHSLIIGLMCVRADLNYQQGLHRLWSLSTRLDMYWPALSHIGEQAVLLKELVCHGDSAYDDLVWGYQERYAEMRYKNSVVTGLFRSNATGSLDFWHLAQEFGYAGSKPSLNSTFIQENPPVDRVVAVPDEPHFKMDMYFNYICARPMPVYGVPGMMDHF